MQDHRRSGSQAAPQFGPAGRIGLVVPANNSVIEPEFWSVLPPGVALFATRILARGDLTPDAVRRMEAEMDRAVAELAATGTDVILLADMVTSFIMEPGWNRHRTAAVTAATGTPCASAWSAMADALAALGVRRIALGTPYPAAIHALAPAFFAAEGLELAGHATLDILAMRDVPEVRPDRLASFVHGLPRADAVVLLATDLPSFASIATLESTLGVPVVTSNTALLWRALRLAGNAAPIAGLGRLLDAH
ncbi:maleate cis-trans isomerase family protein [Falsiroseomonas sp. E2-1-a20]|uniref:maleate cis-trans isomerase family protein n=1 Tax=Falsiroseomonas sp. E2-1-a20 TaxID=3239300 RepID=UPI003F3E958E